MLPVIIRYKIQPGSFDRLRVGFRKGVIPGK